MLGDRNLKDVILKTMDDIYRDANLRMDRTSDQRINVEEVITCLRKSYYDRKQPLLPKQKDKVSNIVRHAMRNLTKNVGSKEYSIDSDLSLVVHADSIQDGLVIKFELVDELPQILRPRDLMVLNASLWIFDTFEGILAYMTKDGESVEFSMNKDKKMFEETIRRARVLSTLLKDEKVPIVEPSEACLTCPYYDRCYLQKKKYSNLTLEKLLGFDKAGE